MVSRLESQVYFMDEIEKFSTIEEISEIL